MTRKAKLSNAELAQRQAAAQTHGAYAFEARGEVALDPADIENLGELRQLVKSFPGRVALKLEFAARSAQISQMLYDEARKNHAKRVPPSENGPIKALGYWMGLTSRILDSVPEDRGPDHEVEYIRSVINATSDEIG